MTDVEYPWLLRDASPGEPISQEQLTAGLVLVNKALLLHIVAGDVFLSWEDLREAAEVRFRIAPTEDGITISHMEGEAPPAAPVWGSGPSPLADV